MKIVYTGSLPSGIVPVDGESVEFVRGEPIEVPDGFAERLCEQRGWDPYKKPAAKAASKPAAKKSASRKSEVSDG